MKETLKMIKKMDLGKKKVPTVQYISENLKMIKKMVKEN